MKKFQKARCYDYSLDIYYRENGHEHIVSFPTTYSWDGNIECRVIRKEYEALMNFGFNDMVSWYILELLASDYAVLTLPLEGDEKNKKSIWEKLFGTKIKTGNIAEK